MSTTYRPYREPYPRSYFVDCVHKDRFTTGWIQVVPKWSFQFLSGWDVVPHSLPRCQYVFVFDVRQYDGLQGEMRVNNRRGYTWKAWALLAPFTCGILVPVSRSMDYRHHATDLIAGSLIGLLTAWIGYRSYYPVSQVIYPNSIATELTTRI